MAPHSSAPALKIPWTEEPGRLWSTGSLRVGHDWATLLSLFTFHFHALEKEMATHSSVLAWRIPGTEEPSRLPSMGSHRVGHNWSDLAVAAVAKLCPNLQAHGLLPARFLCPWESPGKNTGVVSISFSWNQKESNLGLLHCRQILYQLSYERSPSNLWS